jgi:hypothetical protein
MWLLFDSEGVADNMSNIIFLIAMQIHFFAPTIDQPSTPSRISLFGFGT